MATIRSAITIALFGLASGVHSQTGTELALRPEKLESPVYESISFASEGPAHSLSDGNIRGQIQRLLILESGLAYDRPLIRLETLTYGDEGCCRHLVAVWNLDLNRLQNQGVRLPDA